MVAQRGYANILQAESLLLACRAEIGDLAEDAVLPRLVDAYGMFLNEIVNCFRHGHAHGWTTTRKNELLEIAKDSRFDVVDMPYEKEE